MTKQLVVFATAVMTTLLALVILWQFRIVIVYVLLSITVAAALRPLVGHLVWRNIKVRVAWIFLYLVALSTFGFLLFLTGKTAINEIQQFSHTVSVQDQWRLPVWLEGTSVQLALIGRLPPPSKLFEAFTGDKGQLVLPALLGFTQGIAGVLSAVFIILFLSLYWTINQIHFERLWLSLLPSEQRKRARDIWRIIEPDLGAYIRSQIVHSLLAGVLFGLGYWALGSPYPVLLALAGALTCLIPVVGAILVVIPPLLVGLLTGVQLSVVTVLYTFVVLVVLGVWVKPRLFNRMWDNPILTLIILIALANTFGLLGIIIAPPISAVCQILWSLLVSHRLASGAAAHVSDLIERQEHVWATIKAMDGPPPPLVTSSMERLTQLIGKAEPILEVGLPTTAVPPVLPPEPAADRISDPANKIAPQLEQEEYNGRT